MSFSTSHPQQPTAMVVCPHYLASTAGSNVLSQGGNAVDAAIAVQAALAVVYPHMTGLGGDAFWLGYHTGSGQLYGLNGSGRAGAGCDRAAFARLGLGTIPQRGPQAAITVPGGVSSWGEAHQRFGHLPWADLLQPAIELAEQGYPISASQSHWTRVNQGHLEAYGGANNPFLPGGTVPEAGVQVTNRPLGKTLRRLATAGPQDFYQGEIAASLIAYLDSLGGLLSPDDFARHTTTWVDPISTTYRGYQVCQLPPNTQGFTVLQMLNVLEGFNLHTIGHGTADYYHLLVEATKLAFADRDRWLGDPDFSDIPLTELISKSYGDRRRAQLSMAVAQHYPALEVGGDTTYTAVVDGEGNAVSIIQSNYFDFGSAVVPPDLGFPLQNRGALFSLSPDHPNTLEPGKRPFHTLMPGLVLDSQSRPYLVLGTMGGEGQPQTQLALLTRMLDFGFDPQTAIDLPRWVWGRTWGEATTELAVESRIPVDVQQALAGRGHQLKVVPAWADQMGHAHAIQINADGLRGGCDPRSDGAIAHL
ncbi:gamma-glutamyltransferase [Nodosilinea sp. LEGE 07298]|uniref:gamma-glutamyltransferase n=1 Tax=Nodosilinea sp. LEGE 07298 TaxID=2777970 RepID=UPI001881F3AE|nr:gamma-glutamyltransferase [Nodosilinea sp. LEGE 07298]MBE9109350.1 gamma-glutamyltransferase [Nodosilinea sp. LEGE 07298]